MKFLVTFVVGIIIGMMFILSMYAALNRECAEIHQVDKCITTQEPVYE